MSKGSIEIDGELVNVASAQKSAGTVGKIVIEFLVAGETTANKFSELVQMQGAPIKVKLEDIQKDLYDETMEKNQQSDLFSDDGNDMEPDEGDRQSDMFKDQPESRKMITSGGNGKKEEPAEEIEEAEFDEVEPEPDIPEPEPVDEVTDEDVEEWEANKSGSENLPV